MDILKKSLAPITEKAWEEIEEQSKRVLKQYTTGRIFADINGPHGMDFGAVSTGHLASGVNRTEEGIHYGIREVIPLIEVRQPFSLDLMELDNAERDAKDIDLSNLEKAAMEVGAFEDTLLYYGFKDISLPGLFKSAESKPVKVPEDTSGFIRVVVEQIAQLRSRAVEGPYSLILPQRMWAKLGSHTTGFPILEHLKQIIKGSVVPHYNNNDIFIVSERGGDYELVLGQDISLGFSGYTEKKVNLYFTETFVYRVHSPEAIAVLQTE